MNKIARRRKHSLWLLASFLVSLLVFTGTTIADDSHVLYGKIWTHFGGNYSNDLYFPDSGTDDGKNIKERSVKGVTITPDKYSTPCGDGLVRDGAPVVYHLAGGGQCKLVGWARPDDPSDCGAVMHVGASVIQGGNQRCQVTVNVRPVIHLEGSITARYLVWTVVYSPPGASSGPTSKVTYESGSKIGTATSVSKSFKSGGSIEVAVGQEDIAEGSVKLETSNDQKNSSSLEVTKGTNDTIEVSGPKKDGIDHDQDLIYVWVNPQIVVTDDEGKITWKPANNSGGQVVVLPVAWLKDENVFKTRNPSLHDWLVNVNGFTADDFQTILNRDPFWNGSTDIDPARFTLERTVPYEPATDASDDPRQWIYTLSNDSVSKNSTEVTDEFSVSLKLTAKMTFVKLTAEGSFTWTNSASSENTTTSSQSAAATITGPVSGTLPPLVDVYWDNVYGSFMFAFEPPGMATTRDANHTSLTGIVMNGTALAQHVPVELHLASNTYRTFTNNLGEYVFHAVPTETGTLSAAGQTIPVNLAQTQTVNIPAGSKPQPQLQVQLDRVAGGFSSGNRLSAAARGQVFLRISNTGLAAAARGGVRLVCQLDGTDCRKRGALTEFPPKGPIMPGKSVADGIILPKGLPIGAHSLAIGAADSKGAGSTSPMMFKFEVVQ